MLHSLPTLPRAALLLAGSLPLLAAPSLGQCLDVELEGVPGFPVPPSLHVDQVDLAAQSAPGGAAGDVELFRLWRAPATIEVLRVDAAGAVTPRQLVRLGGSTTAPLVTKARRVAVDGDWLAVSMQDVEGGVALDQGRVHVYRRSAGQWRFAQLLIPTGSPQRLGTSLDLEGDRLVVADDLAGHVHVFDRTAAGWRESARVADPAIGSVVLSGDRFAVGRPNKTGVVAPGARIYERSAAGSWTLAASILPPTGADPATFASDLALEGDTAVVGDRGFSSAQVQFGAAMVYRRGPSGWSLSAFLRAPRESVSFGGSVALDGADLLVTEGHHGFVRYRDTGAAWLEQARFGRDSGVRTTGGVQIAGDRVVAVGSAGEVQVVPWSPRGRIEPGCAALPNSSGNTVALVTLDHPSASGAPFLMYAEYQANTPGRFGLFLAGPSAAQLPLGGGQLCVAGGIVRLGQGSLRPLPLFALEQRVIEVAPAQLPGLALPGATVHFQYWYRDPQGSPNGNLSGSVVVTYCP